MIEKFIVTIIILFLVCCVVFFFAGLGSFIISVAIIGGLCRALNLG